MSRINYSEDEDRPGQFALFRANLNRSVMGKQGQASLRELRDALLALPEKRLIAHHLVKDGQVCTNGALVIAKRAEKEGKTREQVMAEVARDEWERIACTTCWHERNRHAKFEGACTRCEDRLAQWAVEDPGKEPPPWMKDCRQFVEPLPDGTDGYGYDQDEEGATEAAAVAAGMPRLVAWRLVELNDMQLDRESPEERYEKVLRWVEKRLEGKWESVWG